MRCTRMAAREAARRAGRAPWERVPARPACKGKGCAASKQRVEVAIAVGVLALADLAVHEATTERIVHQLEVSDHLAHA